jgi:nucleotide-binding universal stress UspA family protein
VLFDGGDHARHALQHAAALADLCRAPLAVGLVENDVARVGDPVDVMGRDAADRIKLKHAIATRIVERAGIEAQLEILVGRPSQVGLQFVIDRGCDLLVIGASTAHNIHDRLWGSRAARVVRDGRCSVLVIRAPPTGRS